MRKIYTDLSPANDYTYIVHDNFVELAQVTCRDIGDMLTRMAGRVSNESPAVVGFFRELEKWATEYRQTNPVSMKFEVENTHYITPPIKFCVSIPGEDDMYELYRQVKGVPDHYSLVGRFHYSVPLSGVTLVKETPGQLKGGLSAILLGHKDYKHYSVAEHEWLTRLVNHADITPPQLSRLRDIVADGLTGVDLLNQVSESIPLVIDRDFAFVLSLSPKTIYVRNALMATATRAWVIGEGLCLHPLFLLMVQDACGTTISMSDYRATLEDTVSKFPDLPPSHSLNYKVWL